MQRTDLSAAHGELGELCAGVQELIKEESMCQTSATDDLCLFLLAAFQHLVNSATLRVKGVIAGNEDHGQVLTSHPCCYS